jgi:hypothetical protein
MTPSRIFLAALAAVLLLAGPLPAQITLTPDDKGVTVKNNNVTVLTIEYPMLVNTTAVELHKILTKTPAADGATITYDGGATCKISIAGGAIIYSFSGVPSDTANWRTQALLDFDNYQKGGTWQVDGGAAKPFPADFSGGSENLFANNGSSITLTDARGNGVVFHVPPYAYLELKDNRKWNWAIFDWYTTVPITPDATEYRITVAAAGASAASPAPPAP